MSQNSEMRVGYVLKMYPRLSETFILNEILAHEAAGLNLDIFSLRQPVDSRIHEAISKVRANVTYIPSHTVKKAEFWEVLIDGSKLVDNVEDILRVGEHETSMNVYQAIKLAEEIKKRNITHLHAHFATIATTVARLAAKFTGITYSFTAHAKDIFHESVVEEDLRRKLSDASAVVTVSDYNKRFLDNGFGSDASVVERVYNGMDLNSCTFLPPRNRPPMILGIGRLVEKKGFTDLVEASAILKKRGTEFQCDIIGEGVLKEELENKIASCDVSSHVKLLGPHSQDEVKQYIHQAAMLAVPCVVAEDGNKDGLPTVILEAMALGTPCISTPVTGIPEVVRDGETGLMVEEQNPTQLADAIEKLLNNRSLGEELAVNARKLIEDEFDIHLNTAAIRDLFLPVDARQSGTKLEVG